MKSSPSHWPDQHTVIQAENTWDSRSERWICILLPPPKYNLAVFPSRPTSSLLYEICLRALPPLFHMVSPFVKCPQAHLHCFNTLPLLYPMTKILPSPSRIDGRSPSALQVRPSLLLWHPRPCQLLIHLPSCPELFPYLQVRPIQQSFRPLNVPVLKPSRVVHPVSHTSPGPQSPFDPHRASRQPQALRSLTTSRAVQLHYSSIKAQFLALESGLPIMPSQAAPVPSNLIISTRFHLQAIDD
jgi:hypothetical protein